MSLFQIFPEMAVVVAIVAAILFIGVAYRNPFRPRWMYRDSAGGSPSTQRFASAPAT